MGALERLKNFIAPRQGHMQVTDWGASFRDMVSGLSVEELYRTQPHLRTVVEFLARNVAHLGVHAFQRTANDGRERLRGDAITKLLARPNPETTRFQLFEALVSDLSLYSVAYWMLAQSSESDSGWELRAIPPSWVVGTRGGTTFSVATYVVSVPGSHELLEVPAKDMIVFRGWNPGKPKHGASPVETIRSVLAEQIEAWTFREQVWKRGGRVSQVLTRPKESPWSPEARNRFLSDWRARWTGEGANAGGTPILEDGMTLQNLGFSARESEWSEVSKVALATVASLYHVAPVMVGATEGATFASMKEHRKMLYSETLGPLLAMIEDHLNSYLVPAVAEGDDVYLEFNIEEKLQGDFEEQAAIMSTAVGGPWMTRNEARRMRNLPPVDEGNELIVPLNVILGGQASPQDGITAGGGAGLSSAAAAAGIDSLSISERVDAATGLIRAGFDPVSSLVAVGLDPIQHLGLLPVTVQRPTNPDGSVDEELVEEIESSKSRLALGPGPGGTRSSGVRAKAAPGDGDAAVIEAIMVRHFERQGESVLSRLGAKAPKWWDTERWDRELASDLLTASLDLTSASARAMLSDAGIDPAKYSVDQTRKFLAAVAASRAEMINAATLGQVEAILAGDGPEGVTDPGHAFDLGKFQRAAVIGVTLATTYATFATVEAGKQTGAGRKTWLVMSGNPRPEHAAMHGETVGLDDLFSNGAKWPGDPVLGADGVAGCSCEVEIIYG